MVLGGYPLIGVLEPVRPMLKDSRPKGLISVYAKASKI